MDIGKRVKEIMDRKNINQAELSRLTGIHPSLICKLVKDQRRWNEDQIFSISRALDINPKSLIDQNNLYLREDPNQDFKSDGIIDLEILNKAIQEAEIFLQNQKVKISSRRKSKFISKLYEHWLVEQEVLNQDLARRYFHLT